jgi:hypothetical protein
MTRYIFGFLRLHMSRVVRLLLLLATAALLASCSGRSPVSVAPSAVVTGGAVRLEWNPVTEPNVDGYRVYYGTASRTYLQPFGQGLASTASTYTVTGLPGSRRYFFAVTATNSLGKESGYSDEVFVSLP